MARISPVTLNFNSVNHSAQVNDFVFVVGYDNVSNDAAQGINDAFEKVDQNYLGKIYKVGSDFILVDTETYPNSNQTTISNADYPVANRVRSLALGPSSPDLFFFIVKNNEVNKSNVKGYYADVNFSNNSRNKVELFSVGAEIQQSSK